MLQALARTRRARRLNSAPISALTGQWTAYIRRFTIRTQQHYRMILRSFVEAQHIKTLADLSTSQIEDYISDLLLTWKPRTANNHLTALKSFHRWLSWHYEIPNYAAHIPMLPEDPPKQRFLSHEEYLKALAACDIDKDRHCLQFLAMTGLRASEACALTWDCVNPQMTAITIIGKGRKRRQIPLNRTLKTILSKYPQKPETRINFIKSKRYQLYRLCERIAKRAEIPRFSPHCLRRYFGTSLLEAGVNISIISKLYGHCSVKVTERYINYEPLLEHITDVLD